MELKTYFLCIFAGVLSVRVKSTYYISSNMHMRFFIFSRIGRIVYGRLLMRVIMVYYNSLIVVILISCLV